MCLCVLFIVNFWIFSGNDAQKTLICNREEKLLLGIKIAVAIVGFMIFIVILIVNYVSVIPAVAAASAKVAALSTVKSVSNFQLWILTMALS